jgi:hypothetical protein
MKPYVPYAGNSFGSGQMGRLQRAHERAGGVGNTVALMAIPAATRVVGSWMEAATSGYSHQVIRQPTKLATYVSIGW